MATRLLSSGQASVTVLPDPYEDGEVQLHFNGKGWHTSYHGTPTKMWEVLVGYVDENTAHNLIEEATGKGID